ncbi:MAG: hypothetical protein GC192_15330 [Bacteroidetes bacterium]|nr:hypothetical protein [Bacteroidota bacterium]
MLRTKDIRPCRRKPTLKANARRHRRISNRCRQPEIKNITMKYQEIGSKILSRHPFSKPRIKPLRPVFLSIFLPLGVFSNFLSNSAMEEKPSRAMKNLKILAIFALIALCASSLQSQTVLQGRTRLNVQECTKLNKTIKDPQNTALQDWVKSIEGNGFIKFNMEKMQNSPDLETVRPLLGMSAPNSFVVTSEAVSPNDENITFVTAQQYYNGILVEGGGYIQGYIGCVTFFLNAFILEDVNIGLTPGTTKQQAIIAVQNHEFGTTVSIPENKVQLVIDQDLTESCNYILAWKLSYLKGGRSKTAYVKASNGTYYREDVLHSHEIQAPTVNYGNVILNDQLNFVGTLRYLKTIDYSIITFDKSAVNEAGYIDNTNNNFASDLEESIPESLAEWPTTGSDGHPKEVYQAHYVVTEARNVLKPFGLNFPGNLYVAANLKDYETASYNRFTLADGTTQEAVAFGSINGKSTALLDAAGHEITHMHLAIAGKAFNSAGEPSGIEEAICDIFGEHAERNSPGGLDDWLVGGLNGLNVRNMANPVFPNYFTAIGSDDDEHKIAGPMERWFTILVDGGGPYSYNGGTYYTPGMDKNLAAKLVLTAINYMDGSTNYDKARSATLMAAEEIYGECSDVAEAVTIAWYAVNVGIPDRCKLRFLGATVYCEEYLGTQGGNVDLLVTNTLPGYTYKWIFPFGWHAIGESAPQNYIGTHLRIYSYTSMPNFPRYYNILLKEYDTNNVFQKYRNITITIKDCDGDDPSNPCGGNPPAFIVGNFDGQNAQVEQPAAQEAIKAVINSNEPFLFGNYDTSLEYQFRVYDISGREVDSGKLDGSIRQLNLPNTGMYIFHVLDRQHKTVQVGKICFIKQ